MIYETNLYLHRTIFSLFTSKTVSMLFTYHLKQSMPDTWCIYNIDLCPSQSFVLEMKDTKT